VFLSQKVVETIDEFLIKSTLFLTLFCPPATRPLLAVNILTMTLMQAKPRSGLA
jgi:hypothetical protein